MSEQELTLDKVLTIGFNWNKNKKVEFINFIASLDDNAIINGKDANGNTLLHLTVEASRQDIVLELINRGANPNMPNKKGETPIDLARKQGVRSMIAKVLGEKTKNGKALTNKINKAKKEARKIDNDECVLDGKSTLFKKPDGEYYLEVHHFLPKGFKKIEISNKKYDLSEVDLDVSDNMVALCPKCHKIVHYGTEQAKYVEKIYDYMIAKRHYNKWLEDNKLDLSKNDFVNMYEKSKNQHDEDDTEDADM